MSGMSPGGYKRSIADHGPLVAADGSVSTPRDAEVVLLSADSEETLRRTHSSYFGAGREIGEVLGTSS
jgi:hypothetical protein